jgi:hypothetical protein
VSDSSEISTTAASQQQSEPVVTKKQLAADVILYTVMRFILVVVLTAIIVVGAYLVGAQVPLLVALVFAFLIAMPLSMVLFSSFRNKITAEIAVVDAQRKQNSNDLRSRLQQGATQSTPPTISE